MTQVGADWPAMRWDLTAPEWYVLNYVGEGFAVESFRLAIKELVVRNVLRVEPVETRRRRVRRRTEWALMDGPTPGHHLQPPLSPVFGLYGDVSKQTLQTTDGSAAGMRPIDGVPVEALGKAARKRFRRDFSGYPKQHVLPALAGKGLITAEGPRLSSRTAWSNDGREAVDALDTWMEVGRQQLGAWVSRDPARALGYVGSGGAAILLMEDLYPEFVRLGQLLVDRSVPTAADAGTDFAIVSDLDLASLATGFGDFNALDAAFGGLDLGIGGGADGGGGGGGNGGGA